MLSYYNIQNSGVRITDKSTLVTFEPPFLVYSLDKTFFLVKKVSPTQISFLLEGKTVDYSIEEFNKIWSGVILFAEADKNSIEPNYTKNLLTSIYHLSTRILLGLGILSLFCLFFINTESHFSIGNYMLIGIYILGIIVSSIILLKQINLQSKYADKICSLLNKHHHCDSVLESKAAKLFGLIGWSEIGLGYFISNLIIAVFTPIYMPYMALLNICALPYSLWSIWYQKFRARQWCSLCLITQLIIWLQFIANIGFGFMQIPSDFSANTIIFIICVCILPFLVINNFLPYITKGNKSENTVQELKSILMKDEVFITLLKKEGRYPIEEISSCIIFGNPLAELMITILTNPHCSPCAAMHKRVEHLLNQAGDNICIKYVFSSFGEQLDSSCQALIEIYQNNSTEIAKKAYDEWFETVKGEKEHFFDKYNIRLDNPVAIEEYARHKQWRNITRLSATPTVLVNGYKLPQSYTLEELVHFTHIRL